MIRDFEHFFLIPLGHFLIQLLIFLLLCNLSLCMKISPLLNTWLANTFSQYESSFCLFPLLYRSFLFGCNLICLILLLLPVLVRSYLRKHCWDQCQRTFPILSSFIVLNHVFKSLIPLWIDSSIRDEIRVYSHFFLPMDTVFSMLYWRDCPSLLCVLGTFVKNCPQMCWFISYFICWCDYFMPIPCCFDYYSLIMYFTT